MVDSINNATGVLTALRQLQNASSSLSDSENRVSTGLRIRQARDGAAEYKSAATMTNDMGALHAVTMSLGRAEAISDTAIAAGEQISKLLIEMKGMAVAASSADLSDDQRANYSALFEQNKEQLVTFIRAAAFDDANTLDGTKPNGVSFLADADAAQQLTLKGRNFLPGGGINLLGGDITFATAGSAHQAVLAIDATIENVGRELADMVSENRRVRDQVKFVGKLADALASGVSRLVDADLAAESALIQALQVKQALTTEALNIANRAPQSLLTLFRSS